MVQQYTCQAIAIACARRTAIPPAAHAPCMRVGVVDAGCVVCHIGCVVCLLSRHVGWNPTAMKLAYVDAQLRRCFPAFLCACAVARAIKFSVCLSCRMNINFDATIQTFSAAIDMGSTQQHLPAALASFPAEP
eukprot:350713-Chlamydomonas_euryale.AAC.1